MDDIFNDLESPKDERKRNRCSMTKLLKVTKRVFEDETSNQDKIISNSNENNVNIETMDIEFDDGTIIIGNQVNQSQEILFSKINTEANTYKTGTQETNSEVIITYVEKDKLDNSKDQHDLRLDIESNEAIMAKPGKKLTRKRSRNPDNWAMNIRKKKREAGEEYQDIKGNIHPKREIKYGCKNETCKFKCSTNINEEQRNVIHDSFWKLSDTKKSHFYGKNVVKRGKTRKRGATERKVFSFEYYFEVSEKKFRVCKDFFLGTLNISSQRIYYFFKHVHNSQTMLPRSPIKGKNKKKFISEEKKDQIREHIRSFPTVESHYCRASSNKTYLESQLSLAKMYRLYRLKVEEPLKFHVYEKIFNFEFNIGFHKPKKDICDKCVAFKNILNPSDEVVTTYNIHLSNKKRGKTERDQDRSNRDKTTAIVTFDLENVFSLPKSNVSSHFYKQKLNCYNLTAHCNIDKKVYCCIWHEGITGRGGVEIANALIRILIEIIKDNKAVTKIILWSDSCVPQNKNSIMTFALHSFLNSPHSRNVTIIEQKFSEPGHGNLQEIDSAHSVIEAHTRNLDIHSPVSLLRVLLALPEGKLKFRVIQMKSSDYYDYAVKSYKLNYSLIPYTKVKNLLYSKNNLFEMKYRNSFDDNFETVNILKKTKSNARTEKNKQGVETFPTVPPIKVTSSLSEEKKQALFSMLGTMDIEDQNFFKITVLKNFEPKQRKQKTKK